MKVGDGLVGLLRPDLNPVLHILRERPLSSVDVLEASSTGRRLSPLVLHRVRPAAPHSKWWPHRHQ
jgi:hypothetical protein